MNTIARKLYEAGLLKPGQYEVLTAQTQLEKEAEARLKDLEVSRRDLIDCEKMNKFRDLAKKFLLINPNEIKWVIQTAHRFKNDQGFNKFIWAFFQIRDKFSVGIPPDLETFLDRALRKHGATLKKKN